MPAYNPRVFSLFILLMFVIATVMSYASIFLPYFQNNMSFNRCILNNDNDPTLMCTYGESLHIIGLVLSVVVLGFIIVYFILRASRNSDINKEFYGFNTLVIVLMFLIFVCTLIALLLTLDYQNTEANNFPSDGFIVLAVSTGLYLLTAIFACILVYGPKKESLKFDTDFLKGTLSVPGLTMKTKSPIRRANRRKSKSR